MPLLLLLHVMLVLMKIMIADCILVDLVIEHPVPASAAVTAQVVSATSPAPATAIAVGVAMAGWLDVER